MAQENDDAHHVLSDEDEMLCKSNDSVVENPLVENPVEQHSIRGSNLQYSDLEDRHHSEVFYGDENQASMPNAYFGESITASGVPAWKAESFHPKQHFATNEADRRAHGTIPAITDPDRLQQLISSKERELHEMHQLRIQSLEKVIEEKNRELLESKEQFEQLRQDFAYNLQLISDRDKEISQLEIVIQRMEGQTRADTQQIAECQKRIQNDATVIQNLRQGVEAAQIRSRQLESMLESEKHEKAVQVAKAAEEARREAVASAAKRRSEEVMQEQERIEEIEKQRNETKEAFDALFQEREREHSLNMSELTRRLDSAEARATKLEAENCVIVAREKLLEERCERAESRIVEVEREALSTEKQMEVAVKKAMESKELQNLEQLREETLREYEDKMGALMNSLQVLEVTFSDMRTEHENQLQQLVVEHDEKLEMEREQFYSTIADLKKEVQVLQSENRKLKHAAQHDILSEDKENQMRMLNDELKKRDDRIRETEESLKQSMEEQEQLRMQLVHEQEELRKRDMNVESLHRTNNDQIELLNRKEQEWVNEKRNYEALLESLKDEVSNAEKGETATRAVQVDTKLLIPPILVDRDVQVEPDMSYTETVPRYDQSRSKSVQQVDKPLFDGDYGAVSPLYDPSMDDVTKGDHKQTQDDSPRDVESVLQQAQVHSQVELLQAENARLVSALSVLSKHAQTLEQDLSRGEMQTDSSRNEENLLSELAALRSQVSAIAETQAKQEPLPDDRLTDALAELGRTTARLRRVCQERDKLVEISNNLHSKLRKAEIALQQRNPNNTESSAIPESKAKEFRSKMNTVEKALGQLADQNQMLKARVRELEGNTKLNEYKQAQTQSNDEQLTHPAVPPTAPQTTPFFMDPNYKRTTKSPDPANSLSRSPTEIQSASQVETTQVQGSYVGASAVDNHMNKHVPSPPFRLVKEMIGEARKDPTNLVAEGKRLEIVGKQSRGDRQRKNEYDGEEIQERSRNTQNATVRTIGRRKVRNYSKKSD